MSKIKYIIIFIIGLLVAGVVLAAPTYRIERTLLPETTDTYELGTSTKRWLNIFGQNGAFENLTVTNCTGCDSGFSTTSSNHWLTTKDTGDLTEGSNLYYTAARVIAELLDGNNAIFTSATTTNATTTNLHVSGQTTLGSLSGFLKATGGVVDTSLIDLTTDVTGVLPDGSFAKSGDWAGTFDTREGSAYLDRTNHTGTQAASTISDFNDSVNSYVHGSTTIPKTYTNNTFGGTQTFDNLIANSIGVDYLIAGYATATTAFKIGDPSLPVPAILQLENSTGVGTLYYDTDDKLHTSKALVVTGDVAATSFTGSGAALTSIPASAITAGTFGSGNYLFPADLTVDTSTFFVDSANNRVAVGTTTPNTRFTVDGGQIAVQTTGNGAFYNSKFNSQGVAWSSLSIPSLVFNGDSNDRPEISFYRGTRAYPEFSIRQHATQDNGATFFVGNGQSAPSGALTIENGGFIGIGTTNPAQALHVSGSGTQTLQITGASTNAYLGISGATAALSNISTAGDAVLRADGGDVILAARNASGGILLSTGSTDSFKAGLTSAGNFGIATSTPAEKLSVTGNALISDRLTSTNLTTSYASTTALTVSGTGYIGSPSSVLLTMTGSSISNAGGDLAISSGGDYLTLSALNVINLTGASYYGYGCESTTSYTHEFCGGVQMDSDLIVDDSITADNVTTGGFVGGFLHATSSQTIGANITSVLCDSENTRNITLTLPPDIVGKKLEVRSINHGGANFICTLDGDGGDTIETASTYPMRFDGFVQLVAANAGGSTWWIFGQDYNF